jgi:hypothetical protein
MASARQREIMRKTSFQLKPIGRSRGRYVCWSHSCTPSSSHPLLPIQPHPAHICVRPPGKSVNMFSTNQMGAAVAAAVVVASSTLSASAFSTDALIFGACTSECTTTYRSALDPETGSDYSACYSACGTGSTVRASALIAGVAAAVATLL